jgi:hypothetical protein
MDLDRPRLSESECWEVMRSLFPGGFGATDVLQESSPAPTLDEIRNEYKETPVDRVREVTELAKKQEEGEHRGPVERLLADLD